MMEGNDGSLYYGRDLDRRSFVKLSSMLALGLASVCIMPATGEAVRFNRRLYKVSDIRPAMGTFVAMTLIHESRDEAEEAIGQAFEEIDRLTRLMNRFDADTAVAHLNREGILRDPPDEVSEVVKTALAYHQLSNGSFDISVKPVLDLLKVSFCGNDASPPSDDDIQKAVRLVGSDKIQVKGSIIRFNKPGMGITLDGIAKGFIVDMASKVLSQRGMKDHLINAGGDIKAAGSRSDKRKPWTVAIQDPEKRMRYPDIVHLKDGAIATSGNYEVYFDREKMFHHIIRPQTGMSPALSASVSVVAKTTTEADALSTSVFVMDSMSGISFIDTLSQVECFVVTREGKIRRSSGWKNASL